MACAEPIGRIFQTFCEIPRADLYSPPSCGVFRWLRGLEAIERKTSLILSTFRRSPENQLSIGKAKDFRNSCKSIQAKHLRQSKSAPLDCWASPAIMGCREKSTSLYSQNFAAVFRHRLEIRRYATLFRGRIITMSKATIAAIWSFMRETKAQTKATATLDQVLAKFGDQSMFSLVKDDGTPHVYNGKEATKKVRLKQALSTIKSANTPGKIGANENWYTIATIMSEKLGLGGSGAAVKAPEVGELENAVDLV